MAVQGLAPNRTFLRRSTLAPGLAALLAAGISLAAALVAGGFIGQDRGAQLPVRSVELELQQRQQRIAFFEARAAADPIDFISLNILAGQYMQRARETGDVADYNRAEYAASRSLEILPENNADGAFYLGSLRLVQHDYSEAASLAARVIDLKPERAAGHGLLGDSLLGLGRYTEAGKAYDRMVNIDASLTSMSRLAGIAFIRNDRLNAIDFWQQAIDRSAGLPIENLAWTHSQLAGVYLALGDYKRSEREYNDALAVYPDYVPAMAGLGAVRAAQDRLADAIQLYEQAATRQPQPQYLTALGDLYARAGRSSEADQQYRLVEAVDALYRAGGIQTDLTLSLFYADHDRNLERALALAEAAYAEAGSVYAADALAWALYKNGRAEQAMVKSIEALRLNTPEASFHYHAGLIAQALGRRDEARAHLEIALKLSPGFSILHAGDARQRLDDLR